MKNYKRLTFKQLVDPYDCECEESENASVAEYEELVNRLAEFEDKVENGTLVELPCNVGDIVYEVFKNHTPPFIQQTKIEKIIITEKGLRLKLSRNSMYETAISSFGKTLFLTEAEAQRALKEFEN